jgi:nucleoprotein TPR
MRITGLMIAIQTNLRAERDKLLAEKESWNKPSGSAPTAVESDPAPSEWEAEKAQLLKARDEALEKAQKAAIETKNIKFQNVSFEYSVENSCSDVCVGEISSTHLRHDENKSC